jgi:hypothetical protein
MSMATCETIRSKLVDKEKKKEEIKAIGDNKGVMALDLQERGHKRISNVLYRRRH